MARSAENTLIKEKEGPSSVEWKDSETLKNLMRAFAGESQARNRYTFAADACHRQGLQVLEAVFLFTAGQEKAHAEIFYGHMKAAAGSTVFIDGGYPADITDDPLQLLRHARHNELEEAETVYPAFAAAARQEGFDAAATAFEKIAAIEAVHAGRFERCAQLLEAGELFVSRSRCGWMCLNCGHVFYGSQAPAACPVCRRDQGFFIRLELAPWGGVSIEK